LAHEFEGESFAQISASTGVGVNTLLARQRYAVLHLRHRRGDCVGVFVGLGQSVLQL